MKRKFIATCKPEPLFLYSPIKSETYSLTVQFSTGARVVIWLWITELTGPRNQVEFLKVLYVVVMEWDGSFGILWEHR